MAKEFFKDLPDTSTPLTAARINGLLNGEEAMGSISVENVVSKNLISNFTPGKFYNYVLQQFEYNTQNFSATDFINVDIGATYIFSHALNGNGGSIMLFDNNKNYLEMINSDTILTPFTITNNSCKYIVINTYDSNGNPSVNETWMQLEKGSTATSYVPYLNLQEVQENTIVNFKRLTITGTSDSNGFVESSIPTNSNILSCKLISKDGICIPYVHVGGNFSFKCMDWGLNNFSTQELSIYVIYMD